VEVKSDPVKLSQYVLRGLGFDDVRELPEHAFIARVGSGEGGKLIVAGPMMINLETYREQVALHR
jgi:hypothetical protein